MSKGSNIRPYNRQAYEDSYDRIFGKRKETKVIAAPRKNKKGTKIGEAK